MIETNENLIQLDFSEEMKHSYRDYAMSVIISRALPDVRDGLKPVQRRILYAMKELGLSPEKPHRKSARIIGDTMGKYHPHGDSSIYDALVHMSQDYSLSIPLIDGHGNFGSIDGDGAAAMRYTEAKLSLGASILLEHLEKGLVEFIPNFDESEQEPAVLPAMLPNLLINGTTGIAVGMATNIPPHNPSEIIDGVIAYINRPDITIDQLMRYIPAPDFPTGGTITNYNEIKEIYERGEGRIRIRAKIELEPSEHGRTNIIVTEIPYTVAGNKTKLVESLVALMKDKVFDELFDIRDESSKEGIRIVIEVKKDRDIPNLLNGLYKKTNLEDTYSVNLLAVKDQQPITFTLKGLIQEFVAFQEQLYTKEYEHLLRKTDDRLEVVQGFIKATDRIDLIIEILRGSSSMKQAKQCLICGDTTGIHFKTKASERQASKLQFTQRQAESILTMQLSKLIGLEILKLHEEQDILLKDIVTYKQVLQHKNELYQIMKTKLKSFKKLFQIPRKTILSSITSSDYVETIKEETIYILVDRFGYTKSIDSASYSRISEQSLKDYISIIPMKNTDKLCFFTTSGKLYQVKASSIPKCKLKEKGSLIQVLCKLEKEEVLLYTALETLLQSHLLLATRLGYIKLVFGGEFESNRSIITASKLDLEDELIGVQLFSADQILSEQYKVILITAKGLSLGFPLTEIEPIKKIKKGKKAITLEKGDFLTYVCTVTPQIEQFEYKGKQCNCKKVRKRKLGEKGQRVNLFING